MYNDPLHDIPSDEEDWMNKDKDLYVQCAHKTVIVTSTIYCISVESYGGVCDFSVLVAISQFFFPGRYLVSNYTVCLTTSRITTTFFFSFFYVEEGKRRTEL